MYNRFNNIKRRVVNEERNIRENQIKKLCEVNDDEDMSRLMEGIEPLLRNKR